MIEFNEFARDLLENVSFENPEKWDDDMQKWNNPLIVMAATEELRDAVYAKNPKNNSDYFWYKGQQFGFTSSENLACYTSKSILQGVYGPGVPELMKELVYETKGVLSSWSVIAKEVDKGFVSMEVDFDEVVHQQSYLLLHELGREYAKSISHAVSGNVDFDMLYNLTIDSRDYGLGRNEYDFSSDTFFKHFDYDGALEVLKTKLSPEIVNNQYHADVSYYLAKEFDSIKRFSKGIKFRVSLWGSDLDLNQRFINALYQSFLYAGNEAACLELQELFCAGVDSNNESVGGFEVRLFNEHFTVLVSDKYFQDVLVYVNKFAPERLASAMAKNENMKNAA